MAIAPVFVSSDGASASVTASRTGVIAYREATGDLQQKRIFAWFDRSGKETHRVTSTGGLSPAISSDGAYAAFSRGVRVWLLEICAWCCRTLYSNLQTNGYLVARQP